jgi:hypothetical protein
MVEFERYSSYAMKAFGNDNDTMIFQTLAELEATGDMIKGMESDLNSGDFGRMHRILPPVDRGM